MTSNSVVPSKACPKLNPSPEISGGMTSAGRNAKKPHNCLRSSTRPSPKQGDSSIMKSRINCPFTVSFGRNRKMLLTSLPIVSKRCCVKILSRPICVFRPPKKVQRRFNVLSGSQPCFKYDNLCSDVRVDAAGSHPGLKLVVGLEGGEYGVVGTDDRPDTLSCYCLSGVN